MAFRFTLNPNGWFTRVLITGGAMHAPQYNAEVPADTKVVTTQGQINVLHNNIATRDHIIANRDETIKEKDKTIAEKDREIVKLTRNREIAAPRLLHFATVVKLSIGASSVSEPTSVGLTGAEYTLFHEDGAWLTLRFVSDGRDFTVAPANQHLGFAVSPRTLSFEPDGRLSDVTNDALKGYADRVRTATADNNGDTVLAAANALLAGPSTTTTVPSDVVS